MEKEENEYENEKEEYAEYEEYEEYEEDQGTTIEERNEDIWDDEELIKAYNSAIKQYVWFFFYFYRFLKDIFLKKIERL